MRVICPLCGPRDLREFAPRGDSALLARPDPQAGAAAWEDHLHLRDNRAGAVAELWHHHGGCGEWLRVTRDTTSHAIEKAELLVDLQPGEKRA